MKAIVTGKEIKWQTERKNETTCQYFRGGGCQATTQETCMKCRFASPGTGFERDELKRMTIDLTKRIQDMELEEKKMKTRILAAQIMESTHYGEM